MRTKRTPVRRAEKAPRQRSTTTTTTVASNPSPSPSPSPPPKCAICLDVLWKPFQDQLPNPNSKHVFTTPCNHVFHKACISKVPNFQCPCCRTTIDHPLLEHRIGVMRHVIQTQETGLKQDILDRNRLKRAHLKTIAQYQRKLKDARHNMQYELQQEDMYIKARMATLDQTKLKLVQLRQDPALVAKQESNRAKRRLQTELRQRLGQKAQEAWHKYLALPHGDEHLTSLLDVTTKSIGPLSNTTSFNTSFTTSSKSSSSSSSMSNVESEIQTTEYVLFLKQYRAAFEEAWKNSKTTGRPKNKLAFLETYA